MTEKQYDRNYVFESLGPINRHHFNNNNYLSGWASILARRATIMARASMIIKVMIIFLGAFAATNGTAVSLFGENNTYVILIFTIVGLTIATLSGVEAAFKLESRASGRNFLASEISAATYKNKSDWGTFRTKLYLKTMPDVPVDKELVKEIQDEAQELLTKQVEYIGEVQQKAADLGVNLLWEEQLEERKELEMFETASSEDSEE